MVRLSTAIVGLMLCMLFVPGARGQVSAHLANGTIGTTAPQGTPVVGGNTSFTSTMTVHITNNTQMAQTVRVQVLIVNPETNRVVGTGTSDEINLPAGSSADYNVTVQSANSTAENATGTKQMSATMNVRQGATILNPPESWGFSYQVASPEDGGRNYYEF